MDERYFLSGIVILFLLINIPFLAEEAFWGDEFHSLFVAKKLVPEMMQYLIEKDIHAPLYFIFLHYWLDSFGSDEFSARLPSLIFGLLSIVVCYLLAKEMFSEKAARISSLLLAFSNIFQVYIQEARMYTLVTLFVLLQVYFFVKYVKKKKQSDLLGA